MAYVAIESCTISAVLGDESGTGVYTIQSGLSTNSKVTGSAVCLDGLQVMVTGMSGSYGAQSASAVFTFSATSTNTAFDSKAPLCVNDTSQATVVSFTQGSSTVTTSITLQITDAGQTKVQVI